MLDRYWHGETARISPEAPVPVVKVEQQQSRAGGAANVALNITALGAKVTLLGLTGKDDHAKTLQTQLQQNGVICQLQQVNQPTITKLRVMSRHQQLIRLDFEQQFSAQHETATIRIMKTILPQFEVVVLSDYGKGTLAEPQNFIQVLRKAGKTVLVDPKGTDFSIYKDASLITPNRAEFEAVVGACVDEQQLIDKAEQLREQLNLEALLVTRSEQGMSLFRQQDHLHLSAQAQEVFDVTGAGDTVIGVLAASFAAGHDWQKATTLANQAASLTVAKMGAATVTPKEIEHAYYQQHHQNSLQTLETLPHICKIAQYNGERVVMTNGCFDVLHAGHVHYLTQARQLGERLIVAVNDDDSVKRLKGNSRPINDLEKRMAVLAGLECVDWVIPFSQDTPEKLICELLPDILVKGGDYQVNDIAGHDCVLDNGGRVLILDFVDNCSSTAIINALHHASTEK